MEAKVSLSDIEMQLVCNPDWILTKNIIIQKVYLLFGQLSETYKSNPLLQNLPAEVLLQSAKISKGENYEGLPYVMLDYPRCFGKEDVFAIRTFFWWGNFFTITLQLKGIYKKRYEENITRQILKENLSGAFLNVSDEEWAHHLLPSNMQMVQLGDADKLSNKQTIKLVYKLQLTSWNEAEEFLARVFDQYINLLAAS